MPPAVYVVRRGDQAEEVVISHETAPGKTKIYRVSANIGDPGFRRFVDTIAHYRPETDLRRYDSETALRTMGATDESHLGRRGPQAEEGASRSRSRGVELAA